MKKSDGFTLIELVVGILATALVSGAIMTFLLMGLKANRTTIDANADQRNVKIMITMMEKLASEGVVSSVKYVGSEEFANRDWTLFDENNNVLLSFSGARGSLLSQDGVSMMDGVLASSVTLSETEDTLTGRLLTFAIKTAHGEYTSSVFCRLGDIDSSDDDKEVDTIKQELLTDLTGKDTSTQRIAFLNTLLPQFNSTGRINHTGKPYSLWYCGGDAYFPGWSENTPWCAIFISWAIDAINAEGEGVLDYPPDDLGNPTLPREANVDKLWGTVIQSQVTNPLSPPSNILPGDLIFFDWDMDPSNLEHVGVVLFTENGFVYTIEGNSGGIVALRRYSVSDPAIRGYGILNWK